MSRSGYCVFATAAILLIASTMVTIPAFADQLGETTKKHYQAGLHHKRNGEMANALQELNAAILHAPKFADAYWVRGWVQADLEESEGACHSFNTFIGLAPDDPRCEEARDAIRRLGGTVSPLQPRTSADTEPQTASAPETTETRSEPTEAAGFTDEAIPRQTALQEPESNEDGPQLTPEEAMVLVNEAEQALTRGDDQTAIDKCLRASKVIPNQGRLHSIVAAAYGGLRNWEKAFEHADKLVAVWDSHDTRFFRIAAALALEYPAVGEAYMVERGITHSLWRGEMEPIQAMAEIERMREQVIGDSPVLLCTYEIGRALWDFTVFIYQQQTNPNAMSLGHIKLMFALEDPNCPEDLQPDQNQWIEELTEIDFLWPQSETEWMAYEKQTQWEQMMLVGQATAEEVEKWRRELWREQARLPSQRMEFSTGVVLASHDLVLRYQGPQSDWYASNLMKAATETMANAVQEFPSTQRSQTILGFLQSLRQAVYPESMN